MGASWSGAEFSVERREDEGFSLRLEGTFRPAWMAGLCAGLGERGVSIQRVDATVTDGRSLAELQILPPPGLDPYAIPFAQLVELSPEVQPGLFQTERYRLSESGEHGGTLKLELHAQDSIGFLGRVLSVLAMLSLFPVSMRIETRSRLAHDRFWLSGVGRALPTRQSREVLERMLATTARGAQARPSLVPDRFSQPTWSAPLDGAAVQRAISPSATIAGMFPEALVQAARRRNVALVGARERYVPFEFYPLSEHVELLVQAAELFFPDRPLRAALRVLGRAAPDVLLSSTIGRVVLGGAHDVLAALAAIARVYAVNLRPSRAEIVDASERSLVFRLHEVSYFLDCHHVGVLEGTMTYAGVRGSVHLAVQRGDRADFLCTW